MEGKLMNIENDSIRTFPVKNNTAYKYTFDNEFYILE